MIHAKEISFHYTQGKQVLQDISFDLEKGKTLAIVGASGCGKSTLLRLLSGILPNSGGNSLHGDIKIENQTPDQYRRSGKLAFMFQDATLLPHLNVSENIQLPLKIKNKESNELVAKLIKTVGLEEYADYLPKQLSGGMKTRVALARSFTTKPELLLLDEPFSALDIAWKSKLYLELEKLKEETGTTVILVTHDVQEALLLADQILVLGKKGVIIGQEKVNGVHSIMKRLTNISQFNNSPVFHSLYSSIQKWVMDDGIREITGKIEVDKILNKITQVAGSDEEIWSTIESDIISIRKYSNDTAVNNILFNAFMKGKNFFFKYELMWDILEYSDIEETKIKEIAAFYLSDIKNASNEAIKYYDISSNRLYEHLISTRIESSKYPESKRWIYLCDMYASSETDKVIDYLTKVEKGEIEQLNYNLAKEVAQKVKAKIKNEKPHTLYTA